MNLQKLTFNKQYDTFTNVKSSVITQTMAYGKIYELLHKQIWRKAPYRIASYANPYYPTHNGRAVRFISMWNIKSPQPGPYVYGGGDYTFGLNQLFVGQDYRKTYVGNLKDGIYHDDCFIQPKMINVTNGYIKAWCYHSNYESGWDGDGSWEIYTYNSSVYYAENVDSNGQNLVTNAVYETYMDGTIQKHRVIQTNANGSISTIDLGVKTDTNSGIHFAEVRTITGIPKTYVYHFSLIGHGAIVHEEISTPSWSWNGVSDAGWIKCYEDGTVVQYNPETYDSEGGSSIAHYIVLPMMYTDTGDLAMDRVEFVEKWNDYFELIVHEDSEWWQAFVTPILAIITVVFACYTGIIFSPFGAIGTALSVVGTLGGDKTLSLIGGAMMAGAGLYNMVEDAGKSALSQVAIDAGLYNTISVTSSASFETLFSGFISNAGLGNLTQIGSKVFSISNSVSQLGTDTGTATTQTVTDDRMKIVFGYGEDEDEYDVHKQFNI